MRKGLVHELQVLFNSFSFRFDEICDTDHLVSLAALTVYYDLIFSVDTDDAFRCDLIAEHVP